jgi:chromosome segregation ATPase
MSSRDIQVANWEKHLASIIQQTNTNISYLNNSVKPLHATRPNGDAPSDVLPPPPPNPRQYSTTLPPPIFQSDPSELHNTSIGENYYQLQAQEVLRSSHRRASVSRPLQKNVEDDLTKRISQSVKRTVERTIHDKTNTAEARVDRLNDQLQGLNDDNVKIHKHCSNISRSVASQDRLGKRLKDEWEKQRTVLKKLEEAMVKDMGWKEGTAIDLKILKDQQTQDSSLRVTANELRSALETITAKTMIAVDRAAISSKQVFDSELRLLKQDMNTLKEENQTLKRELQNCSEVSAKFASTFDEGHVKNIISNAVHSHLNVVETKILSSTRSAVREDISASEERIHIGAVEKLKDYLGREVLQEGSDINRVFASILESMFDRQEKSMTRKLTSSVLAVIVENEGESSRTFHNHLNTSISMKVEECKKQVMCDVAADIAKANTDANKIKISVENTLNEMLPNIASIKDNTTDDLKNDLHSMEGRLKQLENTTNECPVSAQDGKRQQNLENNISVALSNIQTLSENSIKNEEKLNHVSADMCNVYDAINTKCKRMLGDYTLEIDAKLHSIDENTGEFEEKFQTIQSSCCEMQSKTAAYNKRIEELVSSIGNVNTILEREKESEPVLDSTLEKYTLRLDGLSHQSETLKEGMQKVEYQIENYQGDMVEKMKRVEETLKSYRGEFVETETRLQEQYQEFLSLEKTKTMEDKHASTFTDIVSCFGKVSALDSQIGTEMACLRSEFVDIQDNVIDMNKASMMRINTLVTQVRGEVSAKTTPSECQSGEAKPNRLEESMTELDSKILHLVSNVDSHTNQLNSLDKKIEDVRSNLDCREAAQNLQINDVLTKTSSLEKAMAVQAQSWERCHKSYNATKIDSNEEAKLKDSKTARPSEDRNVVFPTQQSGSPISPKNSNLNLEEATVSKFSNEKGANDDKNVEAHGTLSPPFACSESIEGSIGECDELQTINGSPMKSDQKTMQVRPFNAGSAPPSEVDFSDESVSSFEEESVSTFEDDQDIAKSLKGVSKQNSIESTSYGSSFASDP